MNNSNDTHALDRICELLVEDILLATDDEILLEAAEDHVKLDEISASIQTLIGKARLNVAKKNLSKIKQHQGIVISARKRFSENYDDAHIKQIFDEFTLQNKGDAQLSIAARKGKDLTAQDMRSMLDDFQELGYDLDSFANGDPE
jgi:hypothetical protein